VNLQSELAKWTYKVSMYESYFEIWYIYDLTSSLFEIDFIIGLAYKLLYLKSI
jgi:hypothetical protein